MPCCVCSQVSRPPQPMARCLSPSISGPLPTASSAATACACKCPVGHIHATPATPAAASRWLRQPHCWLPINPSITTPITLRRLSSLSPIPDFSGVQEREGSPRESLEPSLSFLLTSVLEGGARRPYPACCRSAPRRGGTGDCLPVSPRLSRHGDQAAGGGPGSLAGARLRAAVSLNSKAWPRASCPTFMPCKPPLPCPTATGKPNGST